MTDHQIDDYLSDTFLVEPETASKPNTYADRRKQARLNAEARNIENRKKSRVILEQESRQEGLSKSLFQRAQEEGKAGEGGSNKAMNIMLKMGFKPGESLGITDAPTASTTSQNTNAHRTEPIPIHVWSGKQGLGRRKRESSPDSSRKNAKKGEEEEKLHDNYRTRSRLTYEERRNEGRLISALKTCVTLDEDAGIKFNYLWLNPQDPTSLPEDVGNALNFTVHASNDAARSSLAALLRKHVHEDRLSPLCEWEDLDQESPSRKKMDNGVIPYGVLQNAMNYCQLSTSDRLTELLNYMRQKHWYCFWCGAKYKDETEMNKECPGISEDVHY